MRENRGKTGAQQKVRALHPDHDKTLGPRKSNLLPRHGLRRQAIHVVLGSGAP